MMYKRILAVAVCVLMIFTESTAVFAAEGGAPAGTAGNAAAGAETDKAAASAEGTEGAEAAKDLPLEEGTFAPGEVIVSFREDTVKDSRQSLSAAKKMENVGDDFGEIMESASEEKDAAKDAKSEISILSESLGDDFVIEDSIAFDEDLTVSLVSSEKYDTAALIEKLSENEDVKSVEPNYYREAQSVDYSLNDPLAQYAYHVNSPEDNNTTGKSVTTRGTDYAPDRATAAKSARVTDFAKDHSGEDEVVVAVTDSGINYTHEDLKNIVWNNPGNLGLEGEHGYNFFDNKTDVMDTMGHGSHVSGIIAAEANNAKGLAGVASGVNVKIMMLSNSTADRDDPNYDAYTAYRYLGALYYVLKAKQRGVDIVATSNSWGNPGSSTTYDEIFNKLGEEGVVSIVAAGNHAISEDKAPDYPGGGDSPYMIVVGSSNVSGKPSGFTNYGKSNVDLFASGQNILSTICYSVYSPNLYSASDRSENTEYYGQFNSTMAGEYKAAPDADEIAPDTAGEGVSAFGAARFYKQGKDDEDEIIYGPGEEGGEEEDPEDGDGEEGEEPEEDPYADYPESSCKLEVVTDRTYTDNYEKGSEKKPASLKVTIENARPTESYYLYFPYEKNHETTGLDNTRYSITTISRNEKDLHTYHYIGGEVVRYNVDGKTVCFMNNQGQTSSCDEMYFDDIKNFTTNAAESAEDKLLSWDEAQAVDVKETGIGVKVETGSHQESTPEQQEFDQGVHDLVFYIDSLGVSKPVTEEGKTPEDVFSKDTSYELMSGTSMATPSASGAYAVVAALYPKREDQTGSEYALETRARLFSAVRQTDELKDLCSTGGYIDLGLLKEEVQRPSITDAVCDLKKETLTLHGINLTDDLKLTTKSLAEPDAEEKELPSGMKVSFAEDGKTLTISGAKDLFGRYIEFLLRRDTDEVAARGSFFTVKGQKKLDLVLTEEDVNAITKEGEQKPRYILTDTSGKDLYGYQGYTDYAFEEDAGTLYKYDGNKFVKYPGTSLKEAATSYYEELGYNRYQISRGLEVKPLMVRQPIYEDDTIYDFVTVNYSPRDDAEEDEIEKKTYLASLDYTEDDPEWTFLEMPTYDAVFEGPGFEIPNYTHAILDGKIYRFIPTEENKTEVYTCDIETGEWTRLDDLDAYLSKKTVVTDNGRIYLLFGYEGSYVPTSKAYSYDGKTLKYLGEMNFVGKSSGKEYPGQGAVAAVKEGIAVFNYSVEGAGNVFIFDPDTGKCRPLYYSIGDGLSDHEHAESTQSAVETKDGIYYISYDTDCGSSSMLDLYLLSKYTKVFKTRYKDANPLKATVKKLTVRNRTLKKKNVVKKGITVKKQQGKVTYRRMKVSCKKKLLKAAKKKIKVNKKTGKITLKKGLVKGTYKVKVKVRAAGNDLYKAGTKTVTVTIKVK